MTTQIDTTGSVGPYLASSTIGHRWARWEHLDAFTQGYVEAVLRAAEDTLGGFTICGVGFRDLAPETLARIIADCEARADSLGAPWKTRWLGQQFWEMRQRNEFAGGSYDWPPLTVQLGDDGKVRFA